MLAASLLLPTVTAIALVGMAGSTCLVVAVLASLGFVWVAASFARQRNDRTASMLLRASVWYLPALLVALTMDRAVTLLL